MKELLQIIILTIITSCGSNQSIVEFTADEKFELCSELKYNSLVKEYGPPDKLIYSENIHSLFENFLLQEKILTEISTKGYSELIAKVKRKEIKPEFFAEFNKELGFNPYLLFRINSHISCYDYPFLRLELFDKTSWRYDFLDAYWRFEANGDLNSDNNYLIDAINKIPDNKFKMITYRKLFLDLIYTQLN